MNGQTSYPSEEVGRHSAVELAKHGECVIVLAVTETDGVRGLRFVRCGEVPHDVAGDTLVILSAVLDKTLEAITGETI